ncbi:unnamed protein product [Arabidopsis lyrata]|uniref:Predicted protein n=1 Tax=Arabidopsis lyrata subsp. lyrata TaxID=81972 RepID=D7KLW3_ARALL|nr:predicted protein [Arabidopsis lyrata subsp. lyrata]CAH8254512.1 unnamed protein product [Arabidopsis lyrata]
MKISTDLRLTFCSSAVKVMRVAEIFDVSFMIDKRSKTVYVSGKIDPQLILEKITKGGINVVLVWSNKGQNKQNRKEYLMEQCYASGYMNAPNGFSNPQPYIQTFAPPPPYTRQLHPQPPAPPPYEFHQKEPVAKSFPPTPAPPKNFTMGDLQLGCRIM